MAVAPDKFAQAINKVLSDYEKGLIADVETLNRKLTRTGVSEVKRASGQFGGSGAYAKGWTSKFESKRLSSQGTIYNKDLPGLPHLLEHGHAMRGGGRVPGRAHIAPVEEKLIKEFEKAVEKAV